MGSSARSSDTSVATIDLRRPYLNPDAEILPPITDDAPWLLRMGNDRSFRISEVFAELVTQMDGTLTLDEISERNRCERVQVWRVVDQLAANEMLGPPSAKATTRRFKWVRPLTFQWAVVKYPARILGPMRPVIRASTTRPVQLFTFLVTMLGFIALATQWGEIRAAMAEPLALSTMTGIALGALITTALHELGHGAALTYHGGEPKRLGVMLFYLMPSFFIDVSDGWRLAHRHQRVQVALAGIAMQLFIGASAAAATLLLPAGAWRTGILLFALTTLLSMLVNLVPFVKFDGYIALMTYLDESNLRDRAIADARSGISRILFGGRYERQLPQYRWVPAYGFICMIFPLVLILQAWRLWFGSLAVAGRVGVSIVVAATVFILRALVHGSFKAMSDARSAGANSFRVVLVSVGLALAMGAGAMSIQLPLNIEAGYYTTPAGEVRLVLPATLSEKDVVEGMPVELQTRGMVGRNLTGLAAIASTEVTADEGSMTATSPVQSTLQIPFARTVALQVEATPTAPAGAAAVRFDPLPLPEWFAKKYIGGPLADLF